MRALVTGGAGLIGSHLADLLLDEGWDVRVLDNLDSATHERGIWPEWSRSQAKRGAALVLRDIRAPNLHVYFKDIDVVFHQAAFGGFDPNPVKTTETNCAGTARVLQAAAHAGVKKVVVASSQAVYGHGWYKCWECGWEGPGRRSEAQMRRGKWGVHCDAKRSQLDPQRLRETDPVDLPSAYALSKYYTEQLALDFGRRTGLPVVALRYALTYGPRQSVSNPYTGICSIFATRIANGLGPVVYEDGRQTRDFTYVEDVARANLHVALDDRADGEVFNVGTGLATTVEDFAHRLWRAIRRTDHSGPVYLPGAYRPADARHIVTDPSKLEALGWEPRWDLANGLLSYAAWFLSLDKPAERFTDAEERLVREGVVVRR